MTYEQGVRIASRALAIYMLGVALSNLLQIPREITAVFTQLAYSNGPHPTEASQRIATAGVASAIGFLAGNIIGAVIWSLAAILLYRCGRTIQRFFGPASEATDPPQP
jgi:hypothetical protein